MCACVVYALPTDKDGKPAAAAAAKEVKEPKEIKEAATASKDVKDAIKAAKDAKKIPKECEKTCPTAYQPVCAHNAADPNVKPITFGSQCALEVHNCVSGSSKYIKLGFLLFDQAPLQMENRYHRCERNWLL